MVKVAVMVMIMVLMMVMMATIVIMIIPQIYCDSGNDFDAKITLRNNDY